MSDNAKHQAPKQQAPSSTTNANTAEPTTAAASLQRDISQGAEGHWPALPRDQDEPLSPHAAALAARAMEATNSWKPSINRRQSWSKEDQKHKLQMSRVGDVVIGPGFSERG